MGSLGDLYNSLIGAQKNYYQDMLQAGLDQQMQSNYVNYSNGWGQLYYTNGTAVNYSNDISIYPGKLATFDPGEKYAIALPKKEETVLDWLDRRIDEVCFKC